MFFHLSLVYTFSLREILAEFQGDIEVNFWIHFVMFSQKVGITNLIRKENQVYRKLILKNSEQNWYANQGLFEPGVELCFVDCYTFRTWLSFRMYWTKKKKKNVLDKYSF